MTCNEFKIVIRVVKHFDQKIYPCCFVDNGRFPNTQTSTLFLYKYCSGSCVVIQIENLSQA